MTTKSKYGIYTLIVTPTSKGYQGIATYIDDRQAEVVAAYADDLSYGDVIKKLKKQVSIT